MDAPLLYNAPIPQYDKKNMHTQNLLRWTAHGPSLARLLNMVFRIAHKIHNRLVLATVKSNTHVQRPEVHLKN